MAVQWGVEILSRKGEPWSEPLCAAYKWGRMRRRMVRGDKFFMDLIIPVHRCEEQPVRILWGGKHFARPSGGRPSDSHPEGAPEPARAGDGGTPPAPAAVSGKGCDQPTGDGTGGTGLSTCEPPAWQGAAFNGTPNSTSDGVPYSGLQNAEEGLQNAIRMSKPMHDFINSPPLPPPPTSPKYESEEVIILTQVSCQGFFDWENLSTPSETSADAMAVDGTGVDEPKDKVGEEGELVVKEVVKEEGVLKVDLFVGDSSEVESQAPAGRVAELTEVYEALGEARAEKPIQRRSQSASPSVGRWGGVAKRQDPEGDAAPAANNPWASLA